ncbi:restriction endonuclease subunit S [Acidovorax temperans]|uniref:restriction endonuclease subunit S n=1 Tax=Acidovorax temperans TaxID=80878 RepID=UPI0035B23DEA
MLLSNMELIATAPGGVAKLRELILTLAVQGKLVPQDPADEPAGVLLQKIRAEKDRLIAEGKIKRDKPLAEIAEEEKPFELPVGWEWVRLGALSELITSGSRDWAEHYSDSGPIFVRMGNLSRGSYRLRMDHVQHVRPPKNGEGSRTSLEAGDLLLSITGDVGMLGLIPPDFGEAYINQHTCLIRWVSCVRTEFLPIQLLSGFVQKQFNSPQRGIKNSFRLTDVSGVLLALPPLAEQSRIVTRVEALMRLCDALEAKGQLESAQHAQLVSTLLGTLTASTTPEELADNWQRVAQYFDLLLDRPEAIDALEQTLLQLAVRGLLVPQDPTDEPASALLQKIRAEKDRLIATGQIKRDKPLPPITDEEKPFELPQGWEWVRFGDASINRDGERIPVSSSERENRAKVYDYYGASGVIDKIDGFLFDKTLLLIGEDGANLINRSTPIAFLAHGKYWVNNHAHVIDTTHPELMTYLALFINAISLEPYVTGTAQPKMNQAKLNSIVIALPPLPEQSRIVTRVTALRRLCADLRQRLAEREAVQARLAEALVQEVV